MNSKVICFASAKGGSGKTLISASIGTFLCELGKKVLLIDYDWATNGLTLLYLEELIKFREILKAEHLNPLGIFEADTLSLPTAFKINDTIDIIPVAYKLQDLTKQSEQNIEVTLSNTLDEFKKKYDYIIIDAQAGSDIYARTGIKLSDIIVIVSEYDPLSAEGMERLKRILPEHLAFDKTWILFNKIIPEFTKSLSDFLSVTKYLSPIPWDADVVRAFARRELAIDLNRGNEHTIAIMKTTISLLGKEIETEVNKWKIGKEQILREPKLEQLWEVENTTEMLERSLIDSQFKLKETLRRNKFFNRMVIILSTTGVIAITTGIMTFRYRISDLATASGIVTISGIVFIFLGLLYFSFSSGILPMLSGKKLMDLEKKYLQEISITRRKIDDLGQSRNKLRTIIDSDLESLLQR